MDQHRQQPSHTTTNCPQRSMAWITINTEENKVISATQEMIHLLNEDPTKQSITNIWKQIESDQSYQIVSTCKSLRTLCICTHGGEQENEQILICTDITDLNHMYLKRQQNISITRLSMYGTIEAAFQSQNLSKLSVGQPMMRYIHEQDVQDFCSGLNEASKYSTISTFQVRIGKEEEEEEVDYQWSEFTVMTIEGGKILCLIKPSMKKKSDTPIINKQQHCLDNVLRETVTQMQSKFWYAIENGMTLVARSIAASLLLVIQTIWQLYYEEKKSGWTGLFGTCSEYMLRKIVKCTKERPEIEKLTKVISWVGGISQSSSRSFVDNTLDQTSEWLISHYVHINNEYDTVV
jgi:hypothetical protein